jgi:hypothetical protein
LEEELEEKMERNFFELLAYFNKEANNLMGNVIKNNTEEDRFAQGYLYGR